MVSEWPEDKDKPVDKSEKKSKKKSVSKKKTSTVGRIFNHNRIICHDLYKLTLASMKKNLSWHPIDPEDYTSIEHVHFYHTFDSSGKKQIHSTSVGGHFHEMEVEDQGEDMPLKVVCASGPKKWVRRKSKYGKNRYEKVIVDVNDVDKHVHDVIYLQSNELKIRKINEEAALVIGKVAALTQKPKDLDIA